MAVDCNQSGVWSQLQASGQFPDVFAGSGKKTNLCYVATGPAPATIGGDPVTIASSISGWTTDFTPGLFGGPDNLGLGGATANRANIVAPITYPGTRQQWFSTASFQRPGPLQWGQRP